ncbi:hypothetical protein [Umezawaea sp. Da 62-37]|nr:hypothetical protein [Umezawaea sp. Da 62-37]WNV92202.1 hypothetical protein RM788_47930 [Umezawaea sp. Da 62-37]
MSVLLLGSTGNIGPHVVSSLLERGAEVRVLVPRHRPGPAP